MLIKKIITFRHLFIKIKCPAELHFDCMIYQQFTEEFTRQLAKFQKSKGEVIIAGDYNIDLLKINNKPKITEYFDSILEHSFFLKITFPTRFSEHRGTLIDNFLCKLEYQLIY